MFVFLFPFILKGHNDETDKDIDHKKCDDDNINDEENCNVRPIIERRSSIFCVGIDGFICQPT